MKIGLVGAGMVGSATANALMMRGVEDHLALVDANREKAEAEARDIQHATPFAYPARVFAGDYSALEGSAIVIISAGAAQKKGETRLDLLHKNTEIFKQIIPEVARYAPDSKIVVVTNPVDVMTYVAWRLSGVQRERVIGSGTILDTARFRSLIGHHFHVSPKSVHAYVLGEHGDSEVLCWTSADVSSLPLQVFGEQIGRPLTDEVRAGIEDDVRNAAYKIIAGKGGTWYGVGGALARLSQAILGDENAVLTVSRVEDDVLGEGPVALSLPRVVCGRGVSHTLHPNVCDNENRKLETSVRTLREAVKEADKDL